VQDYAVKVVVERRFCKWAVVVLAILMRLVVDLAGKKIKKERL
jgi:hypothetical protein